jgi:hypothetical protein
MFIIWLNVSPLNNLFYFILFYFFRHEELLLTSQPSYYTYNYDLYDYDDDDDNKSPLSPPEYRHEELCACPPSAKFVEQRHAKSSLEWVLAELAELAEPT